MIIFKPYSNIREFLYRFTLLKIGKLHIRLHRILDKDQSTLFHNHPFHYISIILKGGYSETYIKDGKECKAKHGFLSFIFRNNNVFHKIDEISGPTTTLFIAYGDYGWKAFNTDPNPPEDGIFQRFINDKFIWSKRENGIWYIGSTDKNKAIIETRHSIHQHLQDID